MAPVPPLARPRLITYYQTHHDNAGSHISVLPLVRDPRIGLTHVVLAALHINELPSALTLNDHVPSHPRFASLWAELRLLQASGIKVLGMLGGAARGSFTRLDISPPPRHPDDPPAVPVRGSFDEYYAPLAALVRERGLDGLDLDVEERMSLAGIVHLIDRLRADFGPDFIITLAPVASALLDARHNLSGFDYAALEAMRGPQIDWYHAQFYCGWGDCSNPAMYEMVLRHGWRPEKVVVGMVTNPENGSGWVPWEGLAGVVPLLRARHAGFGGVVGWEYFNSLPGGRERPWEWARTMTGLLGVGGTREGEGAVAAAASVSALAAVAVAAAGAPTKPAAVVAVNADGVSEGGAELPPVPNDFGYYSDGIEADEEK